MVGWGLRAPAGCWEGETPASIAAAPPASPPPNPPALPRVPRWLGKNQRSGLSSAMESRPQIPFPPRTYAAFSEIIPPAVGSVVPPPAFSATLVPLVPPHSHFSGDPPAALQSRAGRAPTVCTPIPAASPKPPRPSARPRGPGNFGVGSGPGTYRYLRRRPCPPRRCLIPRGWARGVLSPRGRC